MLLLDKWLGFLMMVARARGVSRAHLVAGQVGDAAVGLHGLQLVQAPVQLLQGLHGQPQVPAQPALIYRMVYIMVPALIYRIVNLMVPALLYRMVHIMVPALLYRMVHIMVPALFYRMVHIMVPSLLYRMVHILVPALL